VSALGQFVHLRLHTEYSLIDGIVRVPELMAAVAAARMPAIALTDQCNLFAMVKFYKEALAAGVKPLIGVDAWIREPGVWACGAPPRRPRASCFCARTSRATAISRSS
jgi:DNA polymerase-3 subunit alpha